MAGTAAKFYGDVIRSGSYEAFSAGYGDLFKIQSVRKVSAALSGATASVAGLILAGSMILGIVARVTTLTTGCTTIKIGDGTTANLWANALAVALGSTTSGVDFLSTFTPKMYAADTNVVLTAVGGGASFTAGVVELVCYYGSFTAPTV
jgi:hypothetical protein